MVNCAPNVTSIITSWLYIWLPDDAFFDCARRLLSLRAVRHFEFGAEYFSALKRFLSRLVFLRASCVSSPIQSWRRNSRNVTSLMGQYCRWLLQLCCYSLLHCYSIISQYKYTKLILYSSLNVVCSPNIARLLVMGSRKPKGAPDVAEGSQSGVTLTKEDIDEIIKKSVSSAIATIKSGLTDILNVKLDSIY